MKVTLLDTQCLAKHLGYLIKELVDAGTMSTNLSGTKDAASQEVKKDVSSIRYIALLNWAHDALLEFSLSKPQDHCSTEVPEGSGNPNPTASTSNSPADQMETLTVETPIPTVSSPVPTAYYNDSQEPSSDARLISKRVANQVETPYLDNILSLTNWFKDILGVTTNSDELNRVEADISNMEIAIIASPTPTLRIHKDHPKRDILKKFAYSDVRSSNTPMDKENPWGKDGTGKDVTPKECHLHAVKMIFRYLKSHPKLGLWYPKESPFELVAYSDSDYGGATQDHKSTTGGCQFLAASCCGQVLWIQNQLLDYGYNFMNNKIYIDNNSAICIVKNPVYHSKTKHIEIRHHFIRDRFEKKLINVDHIHTDENVADLLTKPFDAGRFQYLVASIGMLNP
nr:hypothetical protein [Tanacetum cinerariifolium]